MTERASAQTCLATVLADVIRFGEKEVKGKNNRSFFRFQ